MERRSSRGAGMERQSFIKRPIEAKVRKKLGLPKGSMSLIGREDFYGVSTSDGSWDYSQNYKNFIVGKRKG